MNTIVTELVEHGGCVDIDEVSEEAVTRLMDNLMRKFTRFFQYKQSDLPVVDYGFAFAYSPEGHLTYICSIISGETMLGRSTPSFRERLESKGYRDILLLDSATLLRFGRDTLVKEQTNARTY